MLITIKGLVYNCMDITAFTLKNKKNINCHTSCYCLNLMHPHFCADYRQSLHIFNPDGILTNNTD